MKLEDCFSPWRVALANAFLALSFALAPTSRAEDWRENLTRPGAATLGDSRPLRAQYSFGWSGISAATADVHLEKTPEGSFHLDLRGGTTGLARALWRYDVVHAGFVDGQSLRPLQVREVEYTRGKEITTQLDFAPSVVRSERQSKKSGKLESNIRRFEFPDLFSLDAAILFLRSRSLAEGAVYRVVVYPENSAYLCTITVTGHENITVPAGQYRALKLDVQLSKVGAKLELQPHKKFRNASVWLSDDNDRLILRIEAQVYIGSVFAELRSVQWDDAHR